MSPLSIYDAANPANIPATAGAVAGYDDGPESKWPADAWDRFTDAALKVHITVTGAVLTSDVADVENGDLTPESGARWAALKRSVRHERPALYCSLDSWDACKAAVVAAGLTAADVDWCVASWGPAAGQGTPHLIAGTVWTQYDHDLAPGYDVGEADPAWRPSAAIASPPGQPPAPTPPVPPAPTAPTEGDLGIVLRTLHVVNTGDASQSMTGGDVRTVQTLLNAKAGAGLAVDGVYWNATAGAVRNWQARHALAVDGIVGTGQTWPSLIDD